jgi:hypothetical protein
MTPTPSPQTEAEKMLREAWLILSYEPEVTE